MATINEHIELLKKAGLIEATIMRDFSGICGVSIQGLTWEGHDFLDVAKDDSIWLKAKETILKPAVSITFTVLLEWLKEEAKKKLGL